MAISRYYAKTTPCKEISQYVGIDRQGFITHVHKCVQSGMTIDNFGKVWNLDHIVPVELFDINNTEELMLCYNYNNIMPMFINDNRMKGASVHFSLVKLDSLMYTNVFIDKLKERCINEIKNRYDKYLM